MKTKSNRESRSCLRGAVIIMAVVMVLCGCKSTKIESVKPYSGLSVPDMEVALMPGDLVEVKFFYTPELNEVQRVRPDGKISLQLVGNVVAAGTTPEALTTLLTSMYTGLIERPTVAVFVREMNQRKVFVGGAVSSPGVFDMPGNITALGAIMQAGGFDEREADISQILVLREENGDRMAFCLDFQEALSSKSPHDPFYLHAQDVVYVSRTQVVKTAQWIDQNISQMVPKTGFTYFYNTGTGASTIGVDTSARY